MTVPGIAKLSMRGEFEGALAGETLARQQLGGQQPDRGRQRRGDRRDLMVAKK